jgi:hypothetical protein
VSALTERMLVWRSIIRTAPGPNATINTLGLKTSLGLSRAQGAAAVHAVFGPPRDNSFSRSKDGTYLMRLPSVMRGACAPIAATSSGLTRMGSAKLGLIVSRSGLILGRFANLIEQRSQDYGHD